MFFSPDCDHCKEQMKEMVSRMKELSKYQIVLASHFDQSKIKAFYDQYQLSDYSNIMIGKDSKYLLPPFFRMSSLPYIALYDKKGKLITTFDGGAKVDRILGSFGK